MPQSTDLTFLTNEQGNKISDRFKTLIKDTRFFDVLVGYFYTSGFWQIYPEIEATEKIRILVWISTNRETYEALRQASVLQQKTAFSEGVKSELENAEESEEVARGIGKFIEWIHGKKLEIRAYPHEKIHAKLYIMSFDEKDRDVGRVITGSSNFTQSGLSDNLEFNVELKDSADHEFALKKFEELWAKSIDVSEKYVETVEKGTWMNDSVTPYELYLKFLYEYFKDEIDQSGNDTGFDFVPENFKKLRYQTDAVLSAEKIIQEHGWVFISDVVGLGKTYMGTMLAARLMQSWDVKKVLIVAPPKLIRKENPGSWFNAFSQFGFRSKDYECVSSGMLDKMVKSQELDDFDLVLIDEAHNFRNDRTQTFSDIAEICAGKKVVLLTATPFNNNPNDILSQVRLFQKEKNSTVPGIRDLKAYFSGFTTELSQIDRITENERYLEVAKKNAKRIRNDVLRHLMVRRTRKEVVEYYGQDLKSQGMKFPEVAEPQPIYYAFNDTESKVFARTIELAKDRFKYSRYAPLLFLRNELKGQAQQGQRNMMSFMRMLLVKRLESSFHAFNQTLGRMVESYERFIKTYDEGSVYISEKDSKKIYEALESEDFETVERLLETDRGTKYASSDFNDDFRKALAGDLEVLYEIQSEWAKVNRDPKLETFLNIVSSDPILKDSKLLIFTESEETAKYLSNALENEFGGSVLTFGGSNNEAERQRVIDNFDNNARSRRDDYRILVTTDVLSEGVNLHRGNVVINYDIPWNPTRVMQRVGRINRVDTPHATVHTYTCFPTEEGNAEIGLKESAMAKIAAFVSLLWDDAKLLSWNESDVESHKLFNHLLSKDLIEGEDEWESELKYLSFIREVRKTDPETFEKIRTLPKKSHSAMRVRTSRAENTGVLTYYRKGRLEKFVLSSAPGSEELDFLDSAKRLECSKETPRADVSKDFYEYRRQNDEKFSAITTGSAAVPYPNGSNEAKVIAFLTAREVRAYDDFSEGDRRYLDDAITAIKEGSVPKERLARLLAALQSDENILTDPRCVVRHLREHVSERFLANTRYAWNGDKPKEVVLSMYFAN